MLLGKKNIHKILASRNHLIIFLTGFLTIWASTNSYAQNHKSSVADLIVINGDTMSHFDLPEIIVIPAYPFTSKKQKRRYGRLAKKLKKVYPYAKMANDALKKITLEVDSIDDKRIAKKYIKQVDKELQARYGKELKKLTISEGRLLIKLIDRETGSTSYELVKELRGSFSAFMWQSLARLFGENLKVNYNPKEEDKMIEHIVLLIENNQL